MTEKEKEKEKKEMKEEKEKKEKEVRSRLCFIKKLHLVINPFV